jgi:hypothetical protein
LSGPDVLHDEMSDADERLDRALGDPHFRPEDEIGAFVRDVREAFPAEPMLARETHLEAVADAARRLSTEGRSRTQRKESRVRFPRLRSRTAMIVAGLVVAMSSFGGLAVAGALPGGVQDGVANVVASVGVDLPGGDDESSDVEDDATETEASEPSETETPEPSETGGPEAGDQGQGEQTGDQGEDQQGDDQQESQAGDQGEDEQSGDQGDDQQESQAGDQGEDEQSGDQGDDQQESQAGDQGEDEQSGDQSENGGDSRD